MSFICLFVHFPLLLISFHFFFFFLSIHFLLSLRWDFVFCNTPPHLRLQTTFLTYYPHALRAYFRAFYLSATPRARATVRLDDSLCCFICSPPPRFLYCTLVARRNALARRFRFHSLRCSFAFLSRFVRFHMCARCVFIAHSPRHKARPLSYTLLHSPLPHTSLYSCGLWPVPVPFTLCVTWPPLLLPRPTSQPHDTCHSHYSVTPHIMLPPFLPTFTSAPLPCIALLTYTPLSDRAGRREAR